MQQVSKLGPYKQHLRLPSGGCCPSLAGVSPVHHNLLGNPRTLQFFGMETLVCEEPNCPLPDYRVISGHFGALQFFRRDFSKYHVRCTRMLPVRGGIHARFMELILEPQVLEMIDTEASGCCSVPI